MTTYTEIFDSVAGIIPPSEEEYLKVEWILPGRVAVGRDSDGRFVIVLPGEAVTATSPSVARVLTPSRWRHESGEPVTGTVLCLHSGGPFHVAVTTIAVELLRRGIAIRPAADVFPEVESFIELVIRRVLLPPEFILGLLGELLVFDYAISAIAKIPALNRLNPCSLWRGHARQARDLVLNRLAIEVKTTSGLSSRHHIRGLDQVEPRILDGNRTEALYIVSIGLAAEAAGNSRFSVSQLVGRILARLEPDEQLEFLGQLKSYGPEDCAGYDHRTMSSWESYTRRYRLTLEPRIYDMSDKNLRLIRRSDLQELIVLPEGLQYQVELPDRVPGSHGANPRVGLTSALFQLIEQHV